MATKKTVKGVQLKKNRNADDCDFTFNLQNFAMIRFNSRIIIKVFLDLETMSAFLTMTDTFTGTKYEGTAELEEVE